MAGGVCYILSCSRPGLLSLALLTTVLALPQLQQRQSQTLEASQEEQEAATPPKALLRRHNRSGQGDKAAATPDGEHRQQTVLVDVSGAAASVSEVGGSSALLTSGLKTNHAVALLSAQGDAMELGEAPIMEHTAPQAQGSSFFQMGQEKHHHDKKKKEPKVDHKHQKEEHHPSGQEESHKKKKRRPSEGSGSKTKASRQRPRQSATAASTSTVEQASELAEVAEFEEPAAGDYVEDEGQEEDESWIQEEVSAPETAWLQRAVDDVGDAEVGPTFDSLREAIKQAAGTDGAARRSQPTKEAPRRGARLMRKERDSVAASDNPGKVDARGQTAKQFASPEVTGAVFEGDRGTPFYEESALGQGVDTERLLLAMAALLLTVFLAVVCCSKMIRSCVAYLVTNMWDPKPAKHIDFPEAVPVAPSTQPQQEAAMPAETEKRRSRKPTSASTSPVRTHVEGLKRLLAEDVRRQVPTACSYDCALAKPLRSRCVLRLEGIVMELTGAKPLLAPLSEQACVIYSTTVSKRVRGQGLALSFAAANVDFKLTLLDDPSTEVEVMGMDVSMFDMCAGRLVQTTSLSAAPEHWRTFVLSNQVEGAPSPDAAKPAEGQLLVEDVSLEFQETSLLVGSRVTIVGELCRATDGMLSIQPLEPARRTKMKRGEQFSDDDDEPSKPVPRAADVSQACGFSQTVLVSDNPKLLVENLDASDSDACIEGSSDSDSSGRLSPPPSAPTHMGGALALKQPFLPALDPLALKPSSVGRL
eukprot:TRINITY_DN9975_c0_g1_i1.p1 TRINITY_DN9975_c0_g1~~TRINITY_DN9975_c0_g1_i1.p1  ORF type:complete len:758 (+),score=141.06 TRINITY_DN9975_c0_g1_i1:102-2375(+)